ncbi:papain family cysteine protease [Ancylostoma ceylanicum]|uniref:Papain family cysteine protease n=2 Tax=Ancylostoma ceylanicum TaxID=53326 RepID=A0A0D6LKA0_9BILA|nr:papain family cysteine protease [Ancylostoma ceylanicum]
MSNSIFSTTKKAYQDLEMLFLLPLIVAALAADNEGAGQEQLTGQALVDYVRTHQNLFEVEESEKNNERMKFLMPVDFVPKPRDEDRIKVVVKRKLPESFNPLIGDYWAYCKDIIKHIRDQSRCGSCWAVSAAEVMSDRLCVQSEGKIKHQLSDTDILACCGEYCGKGCRGGWPIKAWEWIKENGVCTGGRYSAKNVCKPYAFYPCGNHTKEIWYGECPNQSWPTPKCRKACKYGYKTPYEKDKYYAKSAYILPNDEDVIKQEILANGPVQAVFDVYEDFRLYRKGIYRHTAGMKRGAHAVKIFGWGTEQISNSTHTIATPFWFLANSWNVDWGEGGYFRMVRGEDNCGIESMVTAGLMAT